MESQCRQLSRNWTSYRPIPWIGVFRYYRMPWATLSLSKESGGGACFLSLSSLWFLLWVLSGHWIGGMWLRIVSVSHTTSGGILGIYWRRKVGHRLCWVHLRYHIFWTATNRWTSIQMWWCDLVLGSTR